jgi:hypothetical protein
MRKDVTEFAEMMSATMETKALERAARKEPYYMSPDYDLGQAVLALLDKADQLSYGAIGRPSAYEQVRQTAVHLANFCMIVQRKVLDGHRASPASRFTLPTREREREQQSHDAELKRISTELDCAPVVEEIIRRIRKLKERQA